ncbi:MAG: 30S ribosomal protein S6 [Sandaracinaceae bacterium]|nr:30S ribosomal protein S6 [Sandaracinaceae bacterium]MCC6876321.1 30S ribosomal protein S6 [Sandaracinaceae bacterium]
MSAARKLAREYELIYILRPQVTPSDARKVAERVADVIQKKGARLTKVDNWGKRRLAYPIEKHTRGVFVFVKYVALNDVTAEIERNLRNFDSVVRYQTVRLEETHDLDHLVVNPEEVEYRDIEAATEEEPEPTFEERLGLARPRRLEAVGEDETDLEGLDERREDDDVVGDDDDMDASDE